MLYRDLSTQEEIDLQYDPVRRVSDPQAFDKIIEQRVVLAKAARREIPGKLDIPYGPTKIEALDIYPAQRPKAPIVVFIHGGYWFDGRLTRDKYAWVAKGFRPHGLATVIPDYAVCPKVTVDEIVRECRAAIAWTYKNAQEFGGDASRIYVTGNSAGGHLTAMLAVTDWEGDYGLPRDIIKGGCPISGLYDLAPFPFSWLQPKLQLTGAQVLRNSPSLHARPGLPSMLISWGAEESEEFHHQSESFAEAWRKADNEATLLPQQGCNHFSAIAGFADPNSQFCQTVIGHMEKCWKWKGQ
jgi:arylformamidase